MVYTETVNHFGNIFSQHDLVIFTFRKSLAVYFFFLSRDIRVDIYYLDDNKLWFISIDLHRNCKPFWKYSHNMISQYLLLEFFNIILFKVPRKSLAANSSFLSRDIRVDTWREILQLISLILRTGEVNDDHLTKHWPRLLNPTM